MNSKERHELRYQRRKKARELKKNARTEKYDDFDTVFSFDNLYSAYKKCCCGVGWKASTQRYRINALLNVNKTYKQLKLGTFKGRGFYEFDIVDRGKKRHIKSVHISERVVQRCLCDNSLVPMLSRTLIYDNGACTKKKGIDFALNRLTCHLQRHYRKYGADGYALVFDFSKYFDNIQHSTLINELEKHFTDERLLNLIRKFILDFGSGKGLGLGSQISQICALLYPNKLDRYIKETLKIKNYGRYMDDGYLIHHDKGYLKYCLAQINLICSELGITLNKKKTQIIKLSRGLTFLKTRFSITSTGAIIKRANRRNITKMRHKLKIFKEWQENGKLTIQDINISYNSWKGCIAGRCNAYRTLQSMDNLYGKLFADK